MSMSNFTWQFGQPIHREDKKEDFKGECLDEQVDRIVGKDTVEDILKRLPANLQYDPVRSMRLKVWKVGDLVWQVGYYVYIDPGGKTFQETAVEFENQPDLRLALYLLEQKIKRKIEK